MSMYIEDLIVLLNESNVKLNRYDAKVIQGFCMHNWLGNLQLSHKQAALALQILDRYSKHLSYVVKQDIDPFIKNPVYKNPLRIIPMNKSITMEPDDVWGSRFRVEFPFKQRILDAINQLRSTYSLITWVPEKKYWKLPVSERSVRFLMELVETEQFDTDPGFQHLAVQYSDIAARAESFVPMLVNDTSGLRLTNISGHTPLLQSTDVLPAIFEARQLGITTWDDNIETFIVSDDVNNVTRTFLKSELGSSFDCDKSDFTQLQDILVNLCPVLFVVPGGMEVSNTVLIHQMLNQAGIGNSDISVLFRLPTSTGTEFNGYVRDNHINSPIGENTRAVLISSRFPKTVMKSEIRFNCVITLGSAIVHYSIKDFIESHVNLITFSEKKTTREIDFGNL